jgi:hypothetical protein
MPSRKEKILAVSEDKTTAETWTDDVAISQPDQPMVTADAPEEPAQDAIMNAALDLKDDEEIT